MKKIFLTLLPLIALLFTACDQDSNYLIYNDNAYIQFGPAESRIYTTSYNLSDTTKLQTFYYEEAQVSQDTVFFDIYAIGGTSTVDRPFTLVQENVDGTENAVAGEDYIAFTDAKVKGNYVIKAGEVHTLVPVVLLRSAKLKTSTQTLKFSVVENDNFKVGELTNNWRKVIFSDRLSRPNAWDANTAKYYLGDYSVVKHRFMIDTTGDKWNEEFIVYIKTDFSMLTFYKNTVKMALVNYNNAHPGNPLKDENGTVVVFP